MNLLLEGREVVFDGFTKVMPPRKDEDAILPPLAEGDTLNLVDLKNEKKFTKPPARFSEAALVKELEKEVLADHQLMQTLFLPFKTGAMYRLRTEGSL